MTEVDDRPPSTVLDYVESLRRIAQSLNSGTDLWAVLQAIVEALSDQTHWQLCWVYAMDTGGGFGEVVARRDRIDYTAQSPRPRWAFSGNPAMDALRRNELIAVPDVSAAVDYPELCDTAAGKGVIAAAYIPLSSNDPAGRPMVLCVQSRWRMLDDESQIPFLRAVASLASLAATNARLLMEARQVASRASENAALLLSVIEGVEAGTASAELLGQIERRTQQPMLVLDRAGQLIFIGRAPVPDDGLPEAWTATVAARREKFVTELERAFEESEAGSVQVPLDLGTTVVTAVATRYGPTGKPAATLVTFPASQGGSEVHTSACTAAAVVLLRDRLDIEAQEHLQHDVIRQLLKAEYKDAYEFAARARAAGINLQEPMVLVVAARSDGVSPERVGNTIRTGARHWPGAHAQAIDGYFVLLLSLVDRRLDEVGRFMQALVTAVTDGQGEPGLVLTRGEPCQVPEDYARVWQRCVQAIGLATQLRRRGVVGIDEFGAYRLLLPALSRQDVGEFIDVALGPVLENDRVHQSALFTTVEVFTAFGGRFQETARHLNIHVSTLRYRLRRAETLLGVDLSDNETRFDILLASRLERLRRGPE